MKVTSTPNQTVSAPVLQIAQVSLTPEAREAASQSAAIGKLLLSRGQEAARVEAGQVVASWNARGLDAETLETELRALLGRPGLPATKTGAGLLLNALKTLPLE